MGRAVLFAILSSLVSSVNGVYDYSQYVNPFMGGSGPNTSLATGGGDIFVGGAVPFGVAKVGIDTYETDVAVSVINGGWTPKGLVTAVSMMHESGTGGPAKYGIIPQMPLTDLTGVNVLDNRTYWQKRVGTEKASVGFYSTKLENGVGIELSGARHSGIMEYSFPAGKQKHVLVDVSHYLPSEYGASIDQFFNGGEIKLQGNGKIYTGWGSFGGGFSTSAPMTTYFCGEFSEAPDNATTFIGRNTDPVYRLHTLSNGPVPQPKFGGKHQKSGPLLDRIGALFTWTNSGKATISSRVGISMISAEKACQFKNDEIKSWDLKETVNATVAEWNEDVFSKIQVPTDKSQNKTNLAILYSSLYMMHLMPSDRSGENPLWSNDEPSWDDWYTMWDIFRCTTSLYLLIQPTYFTSMIRGVIDVWKYEGYMPDGRSGNYNGIVQGGSDADNVLADAYIKKLPGVNWTEGYQAMLKDAEVVPYNSYNPTDLSNGIQQGRGALADWLALGYLGDDTSTRSISRTVEYSLNDYSLAVVAKGIAPGDVNKYMNRSANWQNIWAHNLTHKGFTGFLAPRLSNGEFNLTDYNPATCNNGCEWTSYTYEGVPFEYSFGVQHDTETLIKFMGGEAEFEKRLDYIMMANTSEQNLGANADGITTIMNIANEPDFHVPYQYNYINKQHKSVQQSRSLGNQYFHDALYGVPGNSDAGAMNSWMIWQMMGIYPIVTQTTYLIESPWFSDIKMSVNHNKTLHITAKNLNNTNSYYVQSVKLNGKAWKKNWFEHDDLMVNGGTLEFELGSTPKIWETGPVPPSPGHVEK